MKNNFNNANKFDKFTVLFGLKRQRLQNRHKAVNIIDRNKGNKDIIY